MEELGQPGSGTRYKSFPQADEGAVGSGSIVEAYKEYKKAKQDVEDSLALLDEESDEEMREMAKEELECCEKSALKIWSRN